MKRLTILLSTLLFLCFTMQTQAQILNKLKKKIKEATGQTIEEKSQETNGGSNEALNKNTDAKKAFFSEDMVIQLRENGNLNQTQHFDADEVAVRVEQDDIENSGYVDSEGFIYTFNDGEYTKTALVALQSQGLMAPTMMVETYKLPPEPFMAQFQKQTDLGMTANPFNGIVEFAFIYKPDDFRYEDFKETKQKLRGKTHTKFEFLNEPGYEGSYVLFDDKDRLVEIFTKIGESVETFEIGEMPRKKGESLLVYTYKPVNVRLPQAREVKVQGQEMMEGVMKNIVKGGNKPKDDIDEDDYDTSNSKGMTKRMRKSLKEHKVKPSDLPDTYEFDWELQTEMVLNTKKKEVVSITFLVNEGASYQATRMTSEMNKGMGEMIMLFDMDLQTSLMLMEMQGTKYMQLSPIPDPGKTNDNIDKYNISELPPKTIIGYNCEGLKFEDDRYIMKIYHTSEADIKLANFMNFGAQKPSDFPNVDPKVVKQFSNGLIMEMDIVDKKKSKNNVNIIAKALNKTKTIIKPSAYKPMGLMSGGNLFKN